MALFYIVCICLIAFGVYGIVKKQRSRRGNYFLTGLGIVLLIIGISFSVADNKPAPYFKLGTPVSKIKSNDDVKSHMDGAYYTVDDRKYVRYYHSINSNNKDIVGTVKFNYYETDDNANVSHKKLMSDYKKVTADDLKETSTDHYYSKKEHRHYWSTEENDVDGYSQGIIHITANDFNK